MSKEKLSQEENEKHFNIAKIENKNKKNKL